MSFVYNAETHTCHDPQTGITGAMAGGGSGAGNENRCFELSHPEWSFRACFYIEEYDIVHDVKIRDRVPVSANTTYGPHPRIVFGPLTRLTESTGTPDPDLDLMDILHDAVSCLVSNGGVPVKIGGISRRRDHEAKRKAP